MKKVITHPEVGEVTLSRTRRATRISLGVRPDGSVRLSFPVWVSQRRALGFLDGKREWIAATRSKMAQKYPVGEVAPPSKHAVEALRARAKEILPPMVARLAAEHGFRYGAVRIKLTRSRWGSCTARDDINLSISLAALPEHLAEYVVLHELCHTVHKNHSPRFHALLDSVTGGQDRALRKELGRYRPDALLIT
jgi:predicted metal-dependent hydrolase